MQINWSREEEPMVELVITNDNPYYRVTLACATCEKAYVRVYDNTESVDILLWAFEVADGVCKACKLEAEVTDAMASIEAGELPDFMK